MAYTMSESDVLADLAKISIPTFDIGWSISIDVMLEQRPKQTGGTLL